MAGSKKVIRLLYISVGVVASNIIVFSPGIAGLEIGGSAFQTAFGITLLLASALVLVYGSYSVLVKPPAALPIQEIKKREDYIEALGRYKNVKALEGDISFAIEQAERMEKKKDALINVIDQRFESTELSYQKFASVIHEIEKLFFLNVRSLLNRLGVFDEAEFNSVMGGRQPAPYSSRLVQQKTDLYNEFLSFLKSSLDTNEELLLKLDRLLLELSRLDSIEPGDIEQLPFMREIDELIKHTKLYKQ